MFKKLIEALKNRLGTTGVRLKYGWENGGRGGHNQTVASGVVIKAASGRFFDLDGSGNATIATASSAYVIGHLEAAEQTLTAVKSFWAVSDTGARFRIPVSSGTYARAIRGKTCDLAVSSNIQGAAVGISTRDVLFIYDGDEVNNKWVIVGLFTTANALGAGGVV